MTASLFLTSLVTIAREKERLFLNIRLFFYSFIYLMAFTVKVQDTQQSEAPRVKSHSQEHSALSRPGLEPGPLDVESSALTIRPLRPPTPSFEGIKTV